MKAIITLSNEREEPLEVIPHGKPVFIGERLDF